MGEQNSELKKETQAVDKALNGVFNVAEIFQNTGIDQDKNEKIKRTEIFSAISSSDIKGDNAVGLATTRELFRDIRGLNSADGEKRDITTADLRKLAALGDLKAMKMIADGKTIFPTLDTNGDAKVSKMELQKAASGLDNGASKRAVQAMLTNFEIIGGKGAETISANQIKEYAAKWLTAPQEETVDKISEEFGQRKTRLDEANREPFSERVPFWSVNGDAPKQGIVGDCWLIAATSSLCQKDPWAVDKMMKDNKDGTITVKFPYDHEGKNLEATIAKPTDSELALYATTGKFGTYGAILEKALGAIMDKDPELKGKLTGVERDRGKGAPVQELLNGSRTPFAIELLTGEKAKTVDLNSLTPDQMHHILSSSSRAVATCDSDGNWPKQIDQPVKPIDKLPKGAGIGIPIERPNAPGKEDPDNETIPLEDVLVTSTDRVRPDSDKPDSDKPDEKPDDFPLFPKPEPRPKPHPSDKINEDEDSEEEDEKPSAHEFAILNYDEKRRVVTIRNPWGSGELVDKDGKPRDGKDDGKMELTLEEFGKYFKRISLPESVINRGLLAEQMHRMWD